MIITVETIGMGVTGRNRAVDSKDKGLSGTHLFDLDTANKVLYRVATNKEGVYVRKDSVVALAKDAKTARYVRNENAAFDSLYESQEGVVTDIKALEGEAPSDFIERVIMEYLKGKFTLGYNLYTANKLPLADAIKNGQSGIFLEEDTLPEDPKEPDVPSTPEEETIKAK